MEGTLVDPLSATEPTELSELVRQLCREVADLRQEVNDLRRENAELRQQVGYWKAMHVRAVHRAEQLEAEVEQLRGENRKLHDQLFGRKSEAVSPRTVRIVSRAKRIRLPPRRPSGASGRVGPVQHGGTTATCPWLRNSASCPKRSAFARSAARRSHPATPRIPSSPTRNPATSSSHRRSRPTECRAGLPVPDQLLQPPLRPFGSWGRDVDAGHHVLRGHVLGHHGPGSDVAAGPDAHPTHHPRRTRVELGVRQTAAITKAPDLLSDGRAQPAAASADA